jgi:hypothetical protein
MTCLINGHFSKVNRRGKEKDGADFAANLQSGGLSMHLEFVMDKQFVDHKTLPYLKLEESSFVLNDEKIYLSMRSQSTIGKAENKLLQTFKGTFINIMEKTLNKEFTKILNKETAELQSNHKGAFSTALIASLVNMLPVESDVTIPHDVYISYGMEDSRRATI